MANYKLTGSWQMVKTAEDLKCQTKVEMEASKKAWIVVLQSLEKLRCYSCEGYGHSVRDCPTDRRLVLLGHPDGVWRSLHSKHLQKMNEVNNKTLLGEKPFGSGPLGKRVGRGAPAYKDI